jgi:hypothetical protein
VGALQTAQLKKETKNILITKNQANNLLAIYFRNCTFVLCCREEANVGELPYCKKKKKE